MIKIAPQPSTSGRKDACDRADTEARVRDYIGIALQRAGPDAVLVIHRDPGSYSFRATLLRAGKQLSTGTGGGVRSAQWACMRHLIRDLLPGEYH